MKQPDNQRQDAGHADNPTGVPSTVDSGQSPEALLHELQVHQVELEIQNEALRAAQLALEESHARFVDFYEFAPVGYLTLNDEGLIADINAAGAALLGVERARLLQSPFAAYLIPENMELWYLHLASALKHAGKLVCELALRNDDGLPRRVRLDSLRMAREGQRPTLQIVLTDITDRKKSEAARQETLNRFEKLTELVPGVVYQFQMRRDGSTSMPYISNSFRELFRLDPAAVREDPSKVLARVHPDDLEALIASIHASARNLMPWRHEYRLKFDDGSVRWVCGHSLPEKQADGSLLWHGIMTDVTEHKRTEELLRDSEKRFRSFVENINDVLFVLSAEGIFTYVSPQWTEAFGYQANEAIGRPFMPFVHPDDVADCLAFLKRAIDTGKKQSGVEYRVLRKDGSYVWYKANASVMKDPDDGAVKLIGIGRDISERKQAEAELIAAKLAAEEASLAKSRFLAAASHDLRQPMQALSLFNDSLKKTGLSAEQERISDYLTQSIRSLGELLEALLDISKLDAGAVKASPHIIQVEDLVHKIDVKFSPMAAAKSLRFKLSFPFRSMAIMADGKLLMDLLDQLIGNAVEYTSQGGILVAIRRRGDQALVQVWDTGVGIAAERLDAIFAEYFQIGNAERDRTKGLGLGLAIAKRLARLLGTDVFCRSRPGRGSVFEFRLPVVPVDRDLRRASAGHSDAGGGVRFAPRRIAVVEDDAAVAKAIQLSLESQGANVTRYGNAEDALAAPDIADADFYISDFQLPGLNGAEFLDAISRRSKKPVRAVLLTEDISAERIEMTKSSPWTVLFKPVDLPELLAVVDESYDE